MKFSIQLTLLSLAFLFFSCSKNNDPVIIPPVEAKTMADVAYGTQPLQNMDVYLPAGRTTATTKVCIMIHGGSWVGGDKADFNAYVDTLKKRLPEYAIFNLNYRLSAKPVNIFPTQENDVKAALDFIYSKASEYSISDKYVLLGASAGAHLAMLQGYKYAVPVKAKAVVSFFGPSDLPDMYAHPVGDNPLLSFFLGEAIGKTPIEDPTLYVNSSPVTFISASSGVPTILLHGGQDELVRPSQSIEVKDKLTAAGIANEYVYYPNGDHGNWDTATFSDAFTKIVAFLKANVN